MLTLLEMLIIATSIPVVVWPLLPVKRVPRTLDFMPLASVVLVVLHLFIDQEPVRMRFFPLYIFTVTSFLLTIVRVFRHNPNQPKRRVLAAIGSVLATLMLAISVAVPTVVLPFHSLPETTGQFDVGTAVCDLTDTSRVETLAKEAGQPRKIAVQFWYPTDRNGARSQDEISNAAVSTAQASYPVLIFSHGAFGMRLSNASAFRELASHGYVVASIDHTYHSFYTSFADGKGVPVNMKFINQAVAASGDQLPAEETFTITHEWMDVRTADIELVMDRMKSGELGTAAALLNRHMDLTKIGLFGHSLGGAASAQVARERSEVKAAIVLDGTMIGDITGLSSEKQDIVTDQSFPKPLMLMYQSLFDQPAAKATSYRPNISAFDHATDAAYALVVRDSGHLNFTDLPRISPFLSRLLGIGSVDTLQCIKIVNDYSLAFFDRHIKGQPSPLLDGTTSYQGVEFAKRAPTGAGY